VRIAAPVIKTDAQYGMPTSASSSDPAATDRATTYSTAMHIVEIPELTRVRPAGIRKASTSAIV
jgi:hypothetical protein